MCDGGGGRGSGGGTQGSTHCTQQKGVRPGHTRLMHMTTGSDTNVGRVKIDNHKTEKYLYIICLKYF
jgi:hypothetical protein